MKSLRISLAALMMFVMMSAASIRAEEPAVEQKLPADKNPSYFADLAKVNANYGVYDKAVELYMKAIELSPEDQIDPSLTFGLGSAHLAMKEFAQAEAIFELPLLTMADNAKPQYLLSVARLYQQNALYEQAEQMLLRAREYAQGTRYDMMIAEQLLSLYKTTPLGKRAISDNEQRLKDNPKDAEAARALIDLYLYSSEIAKAAEMAALYAELQPENIAAQRDLVFFYLAAGDMEKAIGVCKRLIDIDPDRRADYFTRVVQIYTEMGELDKAEEWANNALASGAASSQTYVAMAQAYLRAENRAKAFESYQKAIEANPGDDHAKVAYANLLAEAGRLDEAQTLLQPLEQVADPRLRQRVQHLLLEVYRRKGEQE